jgi:hypothetical protein
MPKFLSDAKYNFCLPQQLFSNHDMIQIKDSRVNIAGFSHTGLEEELNQNLDVSITQSRFAKSTCPFRFDGSLQL